jgi:flavin-dependent dehydrogenase
MTPIKEPRKGNILIIGDAAAFMEVLVQGAIMYGYRAAKAIVDEIKGKPGLDEYVDYWRRSYEFFKPGMIEHGMRVAFGIQMLEDSDLDYIFGLFESKIYKGYYNEFTFPGLVQKAIEAEMPRIMKERPELNQKIKTIFESASIEDTLLMSKE